MSASWLYAFGDILDAFGSMVNGIHGRHIGQKCLGRTDIARGFSRRICCSLVCRAIRRHRLPPGIHTDSNDSARDVSFEFIPGGKERGMWSAEAHRNTQALGVPHGNIGAQLTGRGEEWKAIRSVAITTRALTACDFSMKERKSAICPVASGYCTMAPK